MYKVEFKKDVHMIFSIFLSLIAGVAMMFEHPLAADESFEGTSGSVVCKGATLLSLSFPFKEDPAYAKHLPIRHFILSEPQMAHFFSHSPLQPESLNFYDLAESPLYLIVQIKNIGPRPVSGCLYFPFSHRYCSISVELDDAMSDFLTYVVPLGIGERNDFETADEMRQLLDGLVWEKLAVGPTEKEFNEQWDAYLENSQYGGKRAVDKEDDSSSTPSFFPIFKLSVQ